MKTKELKEKITPKTCVCGQTPCLVKHKSKFMYCCPDTMRCSTRGLWYKKEQEAVKGWNTAVDEAEYRKGLKI